MKHNELKTKILNIINNKQYKFNYSRTIKNNTELYNEILSQTNFNFEISIAAAISSLESSICIKCPG